MSLILEWEGGHTHQTSQKQSFKWEYKKAVRLGLPGHTETPNVYIYPASALLSVYLWPLKEHIILKNKNNDLISQ